MNPFPDSDPGVPEVVPKSRVYTKTGDGGTTSLVGGVRVPKNHPRLEAYGTVDELNACLGLLVSQLPAGADRDFVQRVQHKLFALGAYLATDSGEAHCRLSQCDVQQLERAIDAADASLPPLRAFVLPGGAPAAAVCHVCRTVCRRAERRMLSLCEWCAVEPVAISFVNRLSDYLFVLSRKINMQSQNREIFWDKSIT